MLYERRFMDEPTMDSSPSKSYLRTANIWANRRPVRKVVISEADHAFGLRPILFDPRLRNERSEFREKKDMFDLYCCCTGTMHHGLGSSRQCQSEVAVYGMGS